MGLPDNIYSLFVSWAKIVLPTAGLVLLSTLFLFSNRSSGPGDIPFAEIEEIARETRLTRPNFSGVSNNGSRFELSAELARPQTENPLIYEVNGLRLALQSPDGSKIDVTSMRAELNSETKIARLDGLTQIQTSTGYQMETRGLIAAYETGRVESLGPLEVRTPYGSLTAGLLLVEPEKISGTTQIIFKNGVRLIYQPNE